MQFMWSKFVIVVSAQGGQEDAGRQDRDEEQEEGVRAGQQCRRAEPQYVHRIR